MAARSDMKEAKVAQPLEPSTIAGSTTGTGTSGAPLSAQAVAACGPAEGSVDDSSGKASERYMQGPLLGKGAFGHVYSCIKRGTEEEFAMKIIDVDLMSRAASQREAEMLQRMAHTRVVKLHDVYFGVQFAYLIMDLHKGGDVCDGAVSHWQRKGRLPVPVVQNMSKMVLQAVAWLHEKNVAHRDVKEKNFLMDRKEIEHPDCRIVLSDLGTAQEVQAGERLTRKCGTGLYWAPEIYGGSYGVAVDMWAVGVMIFRLSAASYPFRGERDCKTKLLICPPRIGLEGRRFLHSALTRDESKRSTASQALGHKFIS